MIDASLRKPLSVRSLRRVLVLCCFVAGGLLLSAAQAFAAGPPEAPIMQCNPLVIPAGGPFVCGTLNPHSKEKLTSAYFTFSAGSTCTGGTQIAVEPEVQGEEDIEVRAKLEGLVPGTEYAYCLVAVNSSGKAVSDPLTFTTTAEPKSEPATAVMTTSATLEGTLEPAGAKLKYQFFFSKGPTCEGGVGTTQAEGENKVSAQVEGLASNTEYTFCLEAKGDEEGFILQGEKDVGGAGAKPVHFKTPETQAEKEAKEKLEREAKAKAEAEAEAGAKAKAEAEATAAKKKQEEEVAAKRKQEEEAAAVAAKKRQEEAAASKSVSVRIVKVKVTSSGVTVTLNASQAGMATSFGPGLKTTSKSVAAGIIQIKVALTKAGKSDREHHRKVKITVELKAAGKAVAESKMVKL